MSRPLVVNNDTLRDQRAEGDISLRLTDLPMPPVSRPLVVNNDTLRDRRVEGNIFLRLADLPMRL